MKKVFLSLAVVASAFAAQRALAGDCMSGFDCDNHCPLAQQANGRRSLGSEGVASAPTVRAALVAEVTRNLSRV
jgi:hypothetical protein